MSMGWILFRAMFSLLLPLSSPYAASAQCIAPASLQAKLRAPNVATYVELGGWFMDRHQYSCASDAYREASRLQPGSARLLYLAGLSLASAGRPDEAIPPLEDAIKIAPNGLKAHLLLASTFAQMQRDEEAKQQWQAALKI